MMRVALPQKTTPIERHAGESAYHTPTKWKLVSPHETFAAELEYRTPRNYPGAGPELNESKDVYHDYIERCS